MKCPKCKTDIYDREVIEAALEASLDYQRIAGLKRQAMVSKIYMFHEVKIGRLFGSDVTIKVEFDFTEGKNEKPKV